MLLECLINWEGWRPFLIALIALKVVFMPIHGDHAWENFCWLVHVLTFKLLVFVWVGCSFNFPSLYLSFFRYKSLVVVFLLYFPFLFIEPGFIRSNLKWTLFCAWFLRIVNQDQWYGPDLSGGSGAFIPHTDPPKCQHQMFIISYFFSIMAMFVQTFEPCYANSLSPLYFWLGKFPLFWQIYSNIKVETLQDMALYICT